VTILEIGSEGTFQVLSTSGDTHLGGADFDQRIIDRLVTGFKLKEGIDLTENAMAMQRVKTEAENAKHQLSQTERVDISIPFIITGKDGQPRNLNLKTCVKTSLIDVKHHVQMHLQIQNSLNQISIRLFLWEDQPECQQYSNS